MSYRFAFSAIAGVLLIHTVASLFGLYSVWPWFDIPMHLGGGFAMGLLALAIHHRMTDVHHMIGHPWWYHAGFVLGFVMLIGVGWEWFEFFIDHSFGLWYNWPVSQLSLSDTMWDFLNDLLGGGAAFILFRRGL